VADITKEKNLPRAQKAIQEGLRSGCGFPIRLGNEVLGVMEFFSHELQESDETLMQWMVSIGSQIGQFMEREMAQNSLLRAHDELEQRVRERTVDLMAANANLENAIQERRRLEHELLEITEKERRRIGLDLHDDLGQKLAGMTLMMKGLQLSLNKKHLPEAEDAQRITELIHQTMEHASGLARDLTLGELEEENLPSALRGLAVNVKNLFDISCRFKTEGSIPPLDKNVITQFYKITQEAVTNAVKHGKARQVGINLVKESDRLVLTVRNNGLSFPSMIDQARGMGLRIMNYRANVIGASLNVKRNRPTGTVVTCCLPTLVLKPGKNGARAKVPTR
jgi:signal transduction histidine kinase